MTIIKSHYTGVYFNYEQCQETGDLVLVYYSEFKYINTIQSLVQRDNCHKFVLDFDNSIISGHIVKILVNCNNLIFFTSENKIYKCHGKYTITDITPILPIIDIFKISLSQDLLVIDIDNHLWNCNESNVSMVDFGREIMIREIFPHLNVFLDSDNKLYLYDLSNKRLKLLSNDTFVSMKYSDNYTCLLLNSDGKLFSLTRNLHIIPINHGVDIKFYCRTDHNDVIVLSDNKDNIYLRTPIKCHLQKNFIEEEIIDVVFNYRIVIVTTDKSYFCVMNMSEKIPQLVLEFAIDNYNCQQTNVKSAAKI